MSWLASLHERRSSWSGPLTSSSPELARYFTDGPSPAGVSVSADSALTYPAFWAAVSLIAADIASLPLILYKRSPNGGKTRFNDHQLYPLLHDEPNPEMSSFIFRETLQAHVLVWGNAYAEIERDRLGRVAALWPLLPTAVQPFRDRRNPFGPLQYAVANPDGSQTILSAQDVLHVPGLGFDGYLGYSVISKARESLSLGIAMQRFGAKFFANGTRLSGVFTTPRALGPKEKQDNITELRKFHEGVENAHRFALLEGGLDFKQLGIPPDDAQFLESRSFHVQEIARWFRLSPHKLQDLSRATFANIEHLAIDHVTGCLRQWCVRWEQEINRKLIAQSERRIQFVEFLVDGLLRGDLQSRYQAYAVGRNWGWLSADDVREKENMNPLPNGSGQIYLVPQNMAPANRINDVIDAQIAPPPAPHNPAPAPAPDPTAARALEVLEERLRLADQAVAAAQQQATAARESADREAARAEASETEREAAERQAAIAAAECAQLTILRDEIRDDRDRILAERDVREADLQRAIEAARSEAAAAALRAAEAREQQIAAETRMQQALDETARWAETASADDLARQAAEQRAMDAIEAADQARAEAVQATAASESAAAQVRDLTAALAQKEAEACERVLVIEAERRVVADRDRAALEAAQAARLAAESERDGVIRERDEAIAVRAAAEAECAHAQQSSLAEQARAEAAEQRVVALSADRDGDLEQRVRDLQASIQDRTGAVLAAQRGLIVDIMRRMLERESDRARRAQTTPDKLRHWIDSFYPNHAELMVTALLPAVRVHVAWMDRGEDAETLTRQLVAQHIEESKRQISAVAEGDAEDLAGSLYQLFERWTRDRVPVIADMLLAKEIARAAHS